MTMREKIARAICRAEIASLDAEYWFGKTEDQVVDESFCEFLTYADAALAALADPTPEMVEALRKGGYAVPDRGTVFIEDGDIRTAFIAAIRAAAKGE